SEYLALCLVLLPELQIRPQIRQVISKVNSPHESENKQLSCARQQTLRSSPPHAPRGLLPADSSGRRHRRRCYRSTATGQVCSKHQPFAGNLRKTSRNHSSVPCPAPFVVNPGPHRYSN